MNKNTKIYFILIYLLIAAAVLLIPHQVTSLITEEPLRARYQEVERKMLEQGSYAHSSGYQFLGQIDEGYGSGELSGNILIQDIAFLSPHSPSSDLVNGNGIFDRHRSGIVTYAVQKGDTPSYIAASFGISTNTLLWANELSYWSIIRPGQELTIPPTTGVVHQVKSGETLAVIIKKYSGDFDKTLVYNGLPANGVIKAGQSIIIPDGKKPVYSQPASQYAYQISNYPGPYGGKSRAFPWGQCTWYVAQKRYVPWGGHAKYWLGNARAYGFETGAEPRVGAIMATSESWYGHVAYVEAVSGDYITVSEMHGVPSWKRGKWATRVFNKDDWRIRGYIY